METIKAGFSLDDLVSMAMFARVVEAKSVTAAAKQLQVSKSAVSKRLAALETQVGARLLHRTTRRLSLTPDGAQLFARCLSLLQTADDASQLMHGDPKEPRGVLRVNAPAVFAEKYLAEVIAAYARKYSKVSVELSVNNTVIDLVNERVDVSVRMSPQLAVSSLVARKLATTPKLLAASPAYLERRGQPKVPDDLRTHDCLRFTPLPAEHEWRFGETIVPVSGPVSSDDAESLRRAAVFGAGIVALPYFFIADDLKSKALVPVLESHPLRPLHVYALYSKGRVVPAKVRAFIDQLAAAMRPAPWG